MRFYIVFMLFALTYGIAKAEWEPAMNNKDNTQITYVDPSTIRKVGGTADMWSLTDLMIGSYIDGKRYSSQKDHREYNCNTMKMRTIFASIHSENMGRGKELDRITGNQQWEPIPHGTVAEALKKIACGEIIIH